ncbi:MAG: hypothetical protein K8R76_04705 [Candidatus Aegiribacteria sp.]|nr:hypothetical protein [Candidatus Aegiribacteria sp.]
MTDTTDKPEAVLEWISHPAGERPWATVAYVSIILLAGFLAAVIMGNNLWWGLVFAFVLFLSGWTYFLPIRFRMGDDGVSKKSLFGKERMTWTQVRSIVPDKYGVLLSPFPQPTRLAKFRGMSVQFSRNRKEVLEYIRTHTAGQP